MIHLENIKTVLQYYLDTVPTEKQLLNIQNALTSKISMEFINAFEGCYLDITYSGMYDTKIVKMISDCIITYTRKESRNE